MHKGLSLLVETLTLLMWSNFDYTQNLFGQVEGTFVHNETLHVVPQYQLQQFCRVRGRLSCHESFFLDHEHKILSCSSV
ncbi:hypothetical protein Hanom_Chr03g00266711 [Helianthus anomalus]